MQNKGFTRGGRTFQVEFPNGISFNPMQRKVPPRTGMGMSPAGPLFDAAPQTAHGLLNLEQSTKALQGLHPDVSARELLAAPRIAPREGIILGGGRHGSQTGPLRGLFPEELMPKTPEGNEIANRLGIIHEGWEADALKQPGTSMLEQARKWGSPLGLRTGHLSPSVILNESTAISTLPQNIKDDIFPYFKQLRGMEPSWDLIQKGLKREIPFGGQRFSRHAKKRMLEALKSPKTDNELLQSIFGS